jgi:hypothetical protein
VQVANPAHTGEEMNLRKEAKGRPCMIRIPHVCNGNPETTVLCHIHKPSISGGTALKAFDIFGAWGCSDCHDAVDRRTDRALNRHEVMIMFYEGVFRTQYELLKEGKL